MQVPQESVWLGAYGPEYPALIGPLDLEVAIFGDGLTGIKSRILGRAKAGVS